ncbi:hypothetical protein J6590_066765 [Homalodisca vitripennis]|nr:hypothetical protein J6590_066765 [Homalodisca vitripennis]
MFPAVQKIKVSLRSKNDSPFAVADSNSNNEDNIDNEHDYNEVCRYNRCRIKQSAWVLRSANNKVTIQASQSIVLRSVVQQPDYPWSLHVAGYEQEY